MTKTIKTQYPPALPPASPHMRYPYIPQYEICDICGLRHHVNDLHEYTHYNGSVTVYCDECLDRDGLFVCDECGEIASLDDCEVMPNGERVCSYDCAHSAGYEQCTRCGEWVHEDAATYCDNGQFYDIYCDYNCAERDGWVQCDDCGNWFREGDGVTTHDARNICQTCYEYYYVTCERCWEVFPIDECGYSEDDYAYYCSDCIPETDINDWNYKPEPVFFGSGAPFVGTELEIDGGNDRNECANELTAAANGHAYFKYDGSLECGLEIVSHPATLEAHMSVMGWADYREIAKKYGFTSHDAGTCGLHTHIGLDYFINRGVTDTEARARIFALVNYHKNEFVQFARRDCDQWAKYANRCELADFEQSIDDSYELARFIANQSRDRYRAVNVQNENTIELRIFKGTLRLNTLYATLALVDALARFAVSHSIDECISCTFNDLKTYALDNCANETAQAALDEYFNRRGL